MICAGDALQEATRTLRTADIDSARLDSMILLEDVTGRERTYLLAHPEHPLTTDQSRQLHKKVIQRAKHIPLAYIRSSVQFYGRTFLVNHHVLVPRPETEVMIALLKTLPLGAAPRIADIGSGSGCIGITAALEIPGAQVWLYDIDAATLPVAQANARALHATVRTIKTDLLEQNTQSFDVLLANLPYVPTTLTLNAAAMHEPPFALFAGPDGLDAYRRLWQQVAGRGQKPRYILIESLIIQHARTAALAKAAGYQLTQTDHLIQLFTAA